MNRRDFLKAAAGGAVAVSALGFSASGRTAAVAEQEEKAMTKDSQPELQKAIILSMLPDSLNIEDRFKLARDCGFQGLEVHPESDPEKIREMRAAAEKTGVRIHSIIHGGWGNPLSSPDPKVAEEGAAQLVAALKIGKELGADNVLLVPAVVNADTRYADAYERSQKHLRKIIPTAEKLKVKILVENVWNNFLLSPIESARYVDEFKSPWLQAYFDVGNVVAFGWPEDWILTLGHRIGKIHLKDFKRGPRQWVNLRDGDVDWPKVRKALHDVGYKGFVTAELGGGDEAYLRDLSSRMDAIINEKL